VKRAIIIHGWEDTPSVNWFPWLKKTLQKKGWQVETPQMPNTTNPKFREWMTKLQSLSPDKNTLLIGHSLANALILKYLELPQTRILGAIMVAAWDWLMEDVKEFHETFFKGGFDYKEIKKKNVPLVIINSTNDPWIDFNKSRGVVNKIGAKFIAVEKAGHFREKDGYKEFPKLNEVIQEAFEDK
jgi:predicted alpha/beta hydrolase family esterase